MFEQAQERLYWIMPSRWKHGVYKISKTQRTLRQYIDTLLKDVHPDKRFEILRHLPVTLGLTYYQEGTGKRCFRINEDMRKHEEVIGISIDMFKDKIDAVFVLPTENFGLGNFLVLKDNEERASKFKIDEVAAQDKLLSLCTAR